MTDTAASLRRKISSAGDLRSVVRTMKAMAASSIGQYEKSVLALGDYYRTVELGLSACFREIQAAVGPAAIHKSQPGGRIAAVVFGSDQGLVGQFNQTIAEYVDTALAGLNRKSETWAVGERVQAFLTDSGLPVMGLFPVPTSVEAITPLVARIQIEIEAQQAKGAYAEVYVFHNRPKSGSLYEPVGQRLLPLDGAWQGGLLQVPWPTSTVPEVLSAGGGKGTILTALIREYLFISLFRACAESLASENASRLAAMERADKNIDDLLTNLKSSSHRIRQTQIDEELFDVVSGSEALAGR